MQKYFDAVLTSSGTPAAGASVSVTVTATGLPATIYSDNGSTVISGSTVTADASGEYSFYAANGRYTLTISYAGYVAEVRTDVVLFDQADGLSGDGTKLRFNTPFYYTDGTYIERNAIFTVRRAALAPTGIIPTTHQISIGKGDNTNFIGVSGAYLQSRDDASVDASTKGVLYGVQISIVPQVARNNIPYDDATGVVVKNDSSVTGAKGTDAIYVGRNATAFSGNNSEWLTGVTIGANVDYGFRTSAATFTGFNASGRMAGTSGLTYGMIANGEIQNSVTTAARIFSSEVTVANATFTLPQITHFLSSQGAYGASATITEQSGFRASSSLTGAATNYGFKSDINAATGRWGFYGAGDAKNYFQGQTILGTSPTAITTSLGASPWLQVVGNGGAQTTGVFGRYTADANGPALYFSKSRNTTVGGHTLVSDGDTLGTILFDGSDGDQLHRGATIAAQVDGTAADNSMPGRIVISTTPTGSSTPVERVRIDAAGNTIRVLQTTAPSLATNRQMVMNLTSDTNLRISVRGSDGVTRVANITLA